MFDSDQEMFRFLKEKSFVAAVSDALDSLGYRRQVMHQRLRPLLPDPRACGFAGRARTLCWMNVEYVDPDPYGLEIEMMDSLRPGDVVVHSTDLSGNNTPWGELMTTVAKRRGAAGCVCDANIRDCTRIIDLGFPVYYTGIRALDSKGRCIVRACDVPVPCGQVVVRPGDLLFADFDGIVVVPPEVEKQALELALDKAGKEDGVRRAINEERTLGAAYREYGVL